MLEKRLIYTTRNQTIMSISRANKNVYLQELIKIDVHLQRADCTGVIYFVKGVTM